MMFSYHTELIRELQKFVMSEFNWRQFSQFVSYSPFVAFGLFFYNDLKFEPALIRFLIESLLRNEI